MARAVFMRNASCLAALVLVLLEFFANLKNEIRFIWHRPFNRVKIIYLLSRYTGLLSLVANAFLLFVGPLSTIPVDIRHCRKWFTGFTVISCAVMFAIDSVAMLRVYVLYNRNPKIGALFASLLMTEATLVTTCSAQTIGKVPFNAICNVEKTPFTVVYFTCGVIITQLSLLLFTYMKRRQMVGQRQVPIIKLVFREGTWISSVVCCIFLFTVPYSLITGHAKPHVVLIWPTAILSPAACRVILNMYLLSFRTQSTERWRDNRSDSTSFTDTDIQFTSFFDFSGFEDQSMAANRPSESTEDNISRDSPSFVSDKLSSLSDFPLCQPHSAPRDAPQAPPSLLLKNDTGRRAAS
ncbi:hypothetical protein FA13DRAFT_1733158 [Coprinellus micaceus]|uniref:DUF6533 domain-containing protein n=1 Tax=Coprinellus micaceus TaxID=71717 RepID=A0A4Y7T988_COPMI|nr:hypothetical protein FA13DRAFT_1733158 [Coprinellus micaceus]